MKKTSKSKGLKLITISATAILGGAALLYVANLLEAFRIGDYIGIEYPASQAITEGRIFVAKATEIICAVVGGGLTFNGVGFLFSNIRHLKKVR